MSRPPPQDQQGSPSGSPGRAEWNRQTVPSPSAASPRQGRRQERKKGVVMHYLTPEYASGASRGASPQPPPRVYQGAVVGPGQGRATGRSKMYLSKVSAERKISAPPALPSLESPPMLKLRGGGPLGGPDANLADVRKRKLSGLNQRYLSPDDEDMDLKLAQRLGIADSHSDSHIGPGRTSFSSPMPLYPGILKHSDHDLRSHLPAAASSATSPDDVGMVTTPVSPGSVSTASPTSPFSATSVASEPRRKVSIVVDEAPPKKKLSVSSFASSIGTHSVHSHSHSHSHSMLSKTPDLHLHAEENGKTSTLAENGGLKKRSCIEFMYNKVYPERSIESSSWYLFCKKVRKKDEEAAADAWEPQYWQTVCPFPFCLTYRQFARFLGLALVVLLLWGSAFAVLGETLAPGGGLFTLALLVVASHFGGWLVSLTTLPALVGMLLTGILFQNVGLYQMSPDFVEIVGVLRKVALVIILTRAGLDLDPPALRRLLWTLLRIGLVPWIIECVVVAVLMHFLFAMPWIWGLMLGSTVAAVSPAVVVPCLFRLRARGYGTAKGIPTLIIAISGIDDAVSVAGFGIISSIMFSNDSLMYQIFQGPLSIVMGLGFGVLWGVLAKYVPERNDPFVVPMRVLMLFGGGLIAVLGSESIGLSGAGPLAVVAAAFVSCYSWTQQGWEVDDNPVATAFEIFWMIFEPILFGLTGTMIKLDELDPHIVGMVIGCLVAGFGLRILCTVGVAVRSRLNTKEKVFVSLSLMAKATVQAALCTVPLDTVREQIHASGVEQTAEQKEAQQMAELFLTTCVMSILLTAPTIAIIMTVTGPKLLTKTTVDPEYPENWRRHTRPSLRDISIIAEGDEEDEDNLGKLSRRSSRRRSSSAKSTKDSNHTTPTPTTPPSSGNATNAVTSTRETTLTTTSVP